MAMRTSITAQGTAALRALESEKPPDQRICYDPLARRLISPGMYYLSKMFAGYGNRKAPGLAEFLTCRARFIDDYLQACLQSGIQQLVILGAGLDSRAYRFKQLAEVKVFEVDQPAIQQEKIKRLRKIYGNIPDHLTFVPVDFNRDSLAALFDHGYKVDAITLFIWEGVTYYITAKAVDSTLAFVQSNSAVGSSIIFDYVFTSALTAARKRGEITRMQRYSRFTGEPLVFGIDEGSIDRFLSQRGFSQIVNIGMAGLRAAYLTGKNRNRPLSPIYAIVHAKV
jgi:methyltransferase (TIGR00027 family)